MDTAVTFRFESFDGPLNLLLHLIAKNKIDIQDIPIASLLEQYLEYLDGMRSMDMDITCEFIVMAAELILIKTKLLLPKREEEGEEDPRQELVRSLLEYQRYKDIAPILAARYEIGRDMFVKLPEPLPKANMKYEYKHVTDDLRRAVRSMIERNANKLPPSLTEFRGVVGYKSEPVEPKLRLLLSRLLKEGQLIFKDAFIGTKTRSELVATFLALLELMNTKRIQPVENNGECVLVLSDGEIG